MTNGRTDGRTNNPEAICPSNFFEVGGIIKPLLVVHSVVFDFYRMVKSVDPDEMAHDKLSHLDLHCLHRYLFWSARLKGLNVSIQSFQKLY